MRETGRSTKKLLSTPNSQMSLHFEAHDAWKNIKFREDQLLIDFEVVTLNGEKNKVDSRVTQNKFKYCGIQYEQWDRSMPWFLDL